jgi:hypothetical protein
VFSRKKGTKRQKREADQLQVKHEVGYTSVLQFDMMLIEEKGVFKLPVF